MKFAKCKSGYILALKAEIEDGPFRCPECRYEVILRKGDIYTHHFAHNPGEGCALSEVEDSEGTGESELHRFAKKDIYQSLAKHVDVTNLKLERYLDSVRPDISFYFRGIPIAIEVQISSLRPDVIQRRTREYSRRGIFILWISPYGEAEIRDGHFYRMRDWERIMHDISWGTFYYWMEDETLLPVHFEDAQTHKSATHLSTWQVIPRARESVLITDLAQVILPFTFSGESFLQETKLWCLPEMWFDRAGQYLSIANAKERYPMLFPSVRPFPLLDDPFRAEDIPSTFSSRGFIEETIPELKPLFSLFYQKYGALDHKIIWVSIDQTPNRMYFAPDWWQHFRLEYMEANEHRKDLLLSMLDEKQSGVKPSRHTKWP
jgi:hypothetical protein